MYIWIIAAVVFLLDRVTKFLVADHMSLNESLPVINYFFHITYVQNRGAAFGLFPGKTPYIIVLTLIGFAAVFFLRKKIPHLNKGMSICLGSIVGGTLGNFWDRLTSGYVVDFIDFRIWPFIFNIADSALVVGSIILAIMIFKLEEPGKVDVLSQGALVEGTMKAETLIQETLFEQPIEGELSPSDISSSSDVSFSADFSTNDSSDT